MPNESSNPNNPANQEPAGKFETGKAHAKQAAEELRSAAEEKARELRSAAEHKASEYRHKAEQVYDDARNRVSSVREDCEVYVRENPMRAVLTAAGVGFVMGLIFRR